VEVEWDTGAPVTPLGNLAYFAQFLQSGGLFDALCADAPLRYTSPNAPDPRQVLATVVASVLDGQARYAHMGSLKGDRVCAELLSVKEFVSEDSVRRALLRGTEAEWDAWLSRHERRVWEPLLAEPYVLDIDNTVKPVYGRQEGAELGYNPHKPGRPSHNYHTYFVGSLRLVLGVEVLPGKAHAAKHGTPGLWRLVDSLPAHCRPRLVRGDIAYGNEPTMADAESRGQRYLFRLRQTSRTRELIRGLERTPGRWSDAGDGWEGAEDELRLDGWSRRRRCLVLRRRCGAEPARKAVPPQCEFDFVQVLGAGESYEYTVLLTNDVELDLRGAAKLYRERADCENVFDEIKNQWGWAGFVTRELRRCRIMARLVALVYNWWCVYVRLAQRDRHLEAVTSRPLLLHAVGRLVRTGRRRILRLTSTNAMAEKVRNTLQRIGLFLQRLNAEQLGKAAAWARILAAAFSVYLRGEPLPPVSIGPQIVMPLLA
jgi:hypothetical protein